MVTELPYYQFMFSLSPCSSMRLHVKEKLYENGRFVFFQWRQKEGCLPSKLHLAIFFEPRVVHNLLQNNGCVRIKHKQDQETPPLVSNLIFSHNNRRSATTACVNIFVHGNKIVENIIKPSPASWVVSEDPSEASQSEGKPMPHSQRVVGCTPHCSHSCQVTSAKKQNKCICDRILNHLHNGTLTFIWIQG